MRTRGFTLIEVLVVIGIILLLAALLLPAAQMLMESSRKARATNLVAGLHMALRTYASEDPSHRFPPVDPDRFMRASGVPADPRVVDLLVPAFINAGVEELEQDGAASGRILLDPWGRPYRYAVDAVADGTVWRPDPAREDWNARGLEPFAYIWSLGRPTRNGTDDANDPDAAPGIGAPWIYVHNAKTEVP